MLEGLARKLGLGLAVFTILPWLLIVIGFGWFTTDLGLGPVGFSFWFISLMGIPIIVLGAVNAVISARSAGRILRTITTVLSVLFLFCLGMVLLYTGDFLEMPVADRADFPGHHVNLLFAGALITALSWTGLMFTETLYRHNEMPEEASPTVYTVYLASQY